MGHKVHLCGKGVIVGIYIQNTCVRLDFTLKRQLEKGVSYKLIEKSVRRLSQIL
jgi:hypothetical protein